MAALGRVIEGRNVGSIINLADHRAGANRAAGLDLVHDGPDLMIALLRDATARHPRNLDLFLEQLSPETRAASRIDDQAHRVDKLATGPTFVEYTAAECERSRDYGGRTA